MTELTVFYIFTAALMGVIGYYVGKGNISLNINTILLISLVLIFPVIINVGIWLYSSTTPEVITPRVLGMNVDEAKKQLENLSLRSEISGVSFSNEPAGTVISQIPEAGKVVKSSRIIKLMISAKDSNAIIPDLIGKTSEEADSILKASNLVLENVYGITSDEANGKIIEQFPKSGEKAMQGSKISITISIKGNTND